MSTDIEQVTTAIAEFDRVGTGLAMLEKTYAGVLYEVDTPRGLATAKAARASLREPRYEVERIRKAAKAPLTAIGKKLDSEAQRITLAIMKLEDPIDQQIKLEEGRKEAERLAKETAEIARTQALIARIDAIRALPVQASGKISAQILALHDQAAQMVIGEDYQELQESAKQAHTASVAALFGLHQLALKDEAERELVRAQREELAKLRAEQERRQEEDRVRQAETDRLAKVARDAAAAEQALALQVERDALAVQRAEIEKQQEALRLAQLPKIPESLPEPAKEIKKPKRPSYEQILTVIAEGFGVSPEIANDWLVAYAKL